MDIGGLFELMHGAPSRWETFQATCRTWRHVARSHEAFSRSLEGRGSRVAVLSWSGTGEQQPETTEDIVRVWVDGLQRRREEIVQSESRHGSVIVVDGSRWWMFDPERGILRHEGDDSHSVGTYDVASFLDPSVLIPHFDFGDITSGEIDGRDCWAIDAVPRGTLHEHRGPSFPEVTGGDTYRLWVDMERGAALRIEASWEGQPFSIREAVNVVFDAEIPQRLFEFDPPSGAPVFTTDDEPDHHEVSVEEAARLAPFTVLTPTRLPPKSRVEVWYSAGGGFHRVDAAVSITAWDENHQLITIVESASSDTAEDAVDWRTRERDGVRYLIHDVDGQRMVNVRLHGTNATVRGPHEIDTLLEIASSLQPVSDEPRLVSR